MKNTTPTPRRPWGCMKLFGPVGPVLAIAISGALLFITLRYPDSVGQLPDDWLAFSMVFAIIGFFLWWGLSRLRSRLRPSFDILQEIWEEHAEQDEKEVDLSDIEVPPVDDWIE